MKGPAVKSPVVTAENFIPEAVLKKHVAVLGMTGSGKTSTAKLLVETVVEQGARVCVLDPIKSDWWGMISSADGRKPGLPFHILGGPHGHVPLHSSAGKAIGELVSTGALPLSIVDMADFEAGGLQRFFIDFADTLLRKVRGVVYLVMEEAHEFAPKERSGIGAENMAIHAAKKLATAGRSKGVRMIVATQRTQSLHNALLGSCPTMIVHQLTAPADQEPVLKFLKANVKDKNQRVMIEESLASLDVGEGWICSGGIPVERVRFPRIKTFDNSATPEDDSEARQVVSAVVDQKGLRAIIGDAVAEAEANDPFTLKAEIAKLRRELAAKPGQAATAAPDTKAIEAAEHRAYVKGKIAGYSEGVSHGWVEAARQVEDKLKAVSLSPEPPRNVLDHMLKAQGAKMPPKEVGAKTIAAAPASRPTVKRASSAAEEGGCELTPGARKLLDVFERFSPRALTPKQAALAGRLSIRSSAFRPNLKQLIDSGAIALQDSGTFAAVECGASHDLMTPGDILNLWVSRFKPATARMLREIVARGPMDKATIAEASEISPTSSGLGSGLRDLMVNGLVERGHDGTYIANEMFEEG
jgi:hypothetical protein